MSEGEGKKNARKGKVEEMRRWSRWNFQEVEGKKDVEVHDSKTTFFSLFPKPAAPPTVLPILMRPQISAHMFGKSSPNAFLSQ